MGSAPGSTALRDSPIRPLPSTTILISFSKSVSNRSAVAIVVSRCREQHPVFAWRDLTVLGPAGLTAWSPAGCRAGPLIVAVVGVGLGCREATAGAAGVYEDDRRAGADGDPGRLVRQDRRAVVARAIQELGKDQGKTLKSATHSSGKSRHCRPLGGHRGIQSPLI
jgi:hypothetical protein